MFVKFIVYHWLVAGLLPDNETLIKKKTDKQSMMTHYKYSVLKKMFKQCSIVF